ncbi:MAG: holo-ACP synthase [Aquaticitalea sp.]
MKTKIKVIYQRLTNKELASDDSVISPEAFSSVLLDRFNAELSKMGIFWDRKPTTVNSLTAGKSNEVFTQSSSITSNTSIFKSENGFGVGIDLQKIDKFPIVKDPWEDQFYQDNFKEIEIAYCLKKEFPFQSFAGIFAAKEAVFKATGIDRSDITISFNEEGKPTCEFASVSISHDGDYANAVAMFGTNEAVQKPVDRVDERFETVLVPEKETTFNRMNFFLLLSVIFIILYIVYKEWSVIPN